MTQNSASIKFRVSIHNLYMVGEDVVFSIYSVMFVIAAKPTSYLETYLIGICK